MRMYICGERLLLTFIYFLREKSVPIKAVAVYRSHGGRVITVADPGFGRVSAPVGPRSFAILAFRHKKSYSIYNNVV